MLTISCKNCEKGILTFPSRAWRTHYCSNECRSESKQKIIDERKRSCLCCKKIFTPRKYQIETGNGKYCSAECRNQIGIKRLCTKEIRHKALETYIKNMNAGLIKHKSGQESPRWMGGSTEMVKRKIADGRAKDSVKKYRSKNPEKVREWVQRRAGKKVGRLPNGTVATKQKEQNFKCVYCNTDTSVKFHVDHIFPIALGGKHEPSNIQITCPSCNLRKWTKTNFKVEVK